jgi:hypothetical protein
MEPPAPSRIPATEEPGRDCRTPLPVSSSQRSVSVIRRVCIVEDSSPADVLPAFRPDLTEAGGDPVRTHKTHGHLTRHCLLPQATLRGLPFRTDRAPFLSQERARDIADDPQAADASMIAPPWSRTRLYPSPSTTVSAPMASTRRSTR